MRGLSGMARQIGQSGRRVKTGAKGPRRPQPMTVEGGSMPSDARLAVWLMPRPKPAARGFSVQASLRWIAARFEPGLLGRDPAIAEREDMEDANVHPAAFAREQERLAVDHFALPERLVDKEIVAVEPPDHGRALAPRACEQHPVVVGHPPPLVKDADGRGDDLVRHAVLGEARHDALDVVRGLEAEMVVDHLVHFRVRQAHCSSLIFGISPIMRFV